MLSKFLQPSQFLCFMLQNSDESIRVQVNQQKFAKIWISGRIQWFINIVNTLRTIFSFVHSLVNCDSDSSWNFPVLCCISRIAWQFQRIDPLSKLVATIWFSCLCTCRLKVTYATNFSWPIPAWNWSYKWLIVFMVFRVNITACELCTNVISLAG